MICCSIIGADGAIIDAIFGDFFGSVLRLVEELARDPRLVDSWSALVDRFGWGLRDSVSSSVDQVLIRLSLSGTLYTSISSFCLLVCPLQSVGFSRGWGKSAQIFHLAAGIEWM